MPGLRVTHQQAQRLWGLDAATCLDALEFLVDSGFLCTTPMRQYARRSDGPSMSSRLQMTKGTPRKVSHRLAI